MNLKNSGSICISEDDIIQYTLDMFEKLIKAPSKNKLVQFHTSNKFLLMAHDQDKLRLLGNIVANHQNISLLECMKHYEKYLKDTLSKTPTTKRHINTLMHVFGHFSKDFDKLQKELFLNFLEQFREEKITLGEILWEIEPMIYQYNKTYLASQTYFLLYAEKRPFRIS